MDINLLIWLVSVSCLTVLVSSQDQDYLDYLGTSMDLRVDVLDNSQGGTSTYKLAITLTNTGDRTISKNGEWSMYTCHIYMFEPDHVPSASDGYVLPGFGLNLKHIQGCMFSFTPVDGFMDISPGQSRKVTLLSQNWSVSKTDTMPNWYVAAKGLEPRTISSTAGGDLDFVGDFTTAKQWKRYTKGVFDNYNPYTPKERYDLNAIADESDILNIVPTPLEMTPTGNGNITIDDSWVILRPDSFRAEADYLSDKIGITVGTSAPSTNYISLLMDTPDVVLNGATSPEAYNLTMDATASVIVITASTGSGVFYGIQSLLALMDDDMTVPLVTIKDTPRFEYRGLHIDVARNFHDKCQVIKVLDEMAAYKLNRLHLHLTDDEGWRVEIPGLPELTSVGANRCHEESEQDCIMPQLGSGPTTSTSGSGFFNTTDYIEILTRAMELHIQVIPEIDMPGHARAAIRAMEERYRIYSDVNNMAEANRYRLVDPNDPSEYMSVQMFNDNAINPCLNSSYDFVEKVISELQILHNGVNPLETFHFGGDEVAAGAWVNSSACQLLMSQDQTLTDAKMLKELFTRRVATISTNLGLSLGGWEDGLMASDGQPYNRSLIENDNVYGYAWDNVWEWGVAGRAHTLANSGYKVVLAHATHLYYDHPYEPDPEERGYYWAPRFTDTHKVFGYLPENIYGNIDFRRNGAPITLAEVCGDNDVGCPALTQPDNVVGMQGNIWSETVRTKDNLYSMLFPRLLALAERAWHKGSWEYITDAQERKTDMMIDWNRFARTLGHRELKRLDQAGIHYRVPPPGAKVEMGSLFVNAPYPGLTIEYSDDMEQTWKLAVDGLMAPMQAIHLRTRSSDGTRASRVISLMPEPYEPPSVEWADQDIVDYIGQYLNIEVSPGNNLVRLEMIITLSNTGDESIETKTWVIYFYSIYMLENKYLPNTWGTIFPENGLRLNHVTGSLFSIEPTPDFKPIKPNGSLKLVILNSGPIAARTDISPNWYVSACGMQPRIIEATGGVSLDFVADFDTPEMWKRGPKDTYDPYTAETRYNMYDTEDLRGPQVVVLPTPLVVSEPANESLALDEDFVIIAAPDFQKEAVYLSDRIKIPISTTVPALKFINLIKAPPNVIVGGVASNNPAAYSLQVDTVTRIITVTADAPVGVFYGIQSLLNLVDNARTVQQATINDAPRYDYRGFHLDVSRHFHRKDEVKKLLEVMSIYKLNKFHMHLTDDEGWRLQIPGLEELTEIGARRCHDLEETKCILGQFGSGPSTDTAGSGYYSVDEYKEILTYASERHIEVIPEFDMPGHIRAAIKAMELRYQKYTELGNDEEATKYLLNERGDPSKYLSIQMYDDNALNPCMESTYRFIVHVITELQKMHESTNPLKLYHFGGDEVAKGAWMASNSCVTLLNTNPDITNADDLKMYFARRVSNITASLGLNMGGWEDGLMGVGSTPFDRSLFANNDVYANPWDSVWEWGAGNRAYKLANAGYKVVMSQAPYLYFDHPYEPDPEERGNYWSTRFTDTLKVFNFQPDKLYENADTDRDGNPLPPDVICSGGGCIELMKPENIVGMQGHLWSEYIRVPENLYSMTFPRLLALAERAWHKASWEVEEEEGRKQDDWTKFANTLGHREFRKLDDLGIAYHLVPPGAIIDGNLLKIRTRYPGTEVEFSLGDDDTWEITPLQMQWPGGIVHLRTRSVDGRRKSRITTVTDERMTTPAPALDKDAQLTLDNLGQNMFVRVTILSNIEETDSFTFRVTLVNEGSEPIKRGQWRIFFDMVQLIEPNVLRDLREVTLSEFNIKIIHVGGTLNAIELLEGFEDIAPRESRDIVMKASFWEVAKTDVMPNWYIYSEGLTPVIIKSTEGEALLHVDDFKTEQQWKRYPNDQFDPFTPEQRYDRNLVADSMDMRPVIPTPREIAVTDTEKVHISMYHWTITAPDAFKNDAAFLSDKTGVPISDEMEEKNTIRFVQVAELQIQEPATTNQEAYELVVDPTSSVVTITAVGSAGAFYAVQTLRSLIDSSNNVVKTTVRDIPRFEYRGVGLDTSRHFFEKGDVLRLIEVMSSYKLNKFHILIADDQGWRLEIPGIEDLTTVGSTQCHTLDDERDCLLPQFGSGPFRSTGFYTVDDYKDILRFAADRHIAVLPEFAMPSHSRAGIKALESRFHRLMRNGDYDGAYQYLVTDFEDTSKYLSTGFFRDNVLNPCMESTYKLLEHVVVELIKMHKDINPLEIFNFGGDEVSEGRWVNSTICKQMAMEDGTGTNDPNILRTYFLQRISNITAQHGLNLAGWESDLLEQPGDIIYDSSKLKNDKVYAHAWNLIWETGKAHYTNLLANANYKVILNHVTHLFFDQPQEPDPEERGNYWASRFTDTQRVFAYIPDDIYANVDHDRAGRPLTMETICKADQSGCPKLTARNNVIGMESSLFTEYIRNGSQMADMIFPRLLALAERAWHKSTWEDIQDKDERRDSMLRDWDIFANTLGKRELLRLDKMGIHYHLPPPGVRIVDGKLKTNTPYPGLSTEYSKDSGGTWQSADGVSVNPFEFIYLRTRSPDGSRVSRYITMTVPDPTKTTSRALRESASTTVISSLFALIGMLKIVV